MSKSGADSTNNGSNLAFLIFVERIKRHEAFDGQANEAVLRLISQQDLTKDQLIEACSDGVTSDDFNNNNSS